MNLYFYLLNDLLIKENVENYYFNIKQGGGGRKCKPIIPDEIKEQDVIFDFKNSQIRLTADYFKNVLQNDRDCGVILNIVKDYDRINPVDIKYDAAALVNVIPFNFSVTDPKYINLKDKLIEFNKYKNDLLKKIKEMLGKLQNGFNIKNINYDNIVFLNKEIPMIFTYYSNFIIFLSDFNKNYYKNINNMNNIETYNLVEKYYKLTNYSYNRISKIVELIIKITNEEAPSKKAPSDEAAPSKKAPSEAAQSDESYNKYLFKITDEFNQYEDITKKFNDTNIELTGGASTNNIKFIFDLKQLNKSPSDETNIDEINYAKKVIYFVETYRKLVDNYLIKVPDSYKSDVYNNIIYNLNYIIGKRGKDVEVNPYTNEEEIQTQIQNLNSIMTLINELILAGDAYNVSSTIYDYLPTDDFIYEQQLGNLIENRDKYIVPIHKKYKELDNTQDLDTNIKNLLEKYEKLYELLKELYNNKSEFNSNNVDEHTKIYNEYHLFINNLDDVKELNTNIGKIDKIKKNYNDFITKNQPIGKESPILYGGPNEILTVEDLIILLKLEDIIKIKVPDWYTYNYDKIEDIDYNINCISDNDLNDPHQIYKIHKDLCKIINDNNSKYNKYISAKKYNISADEKEKKILTNIEAFIYYLKIFKQKFIVGLMTCFDIAIEKIDSEINNEFENIKYYKIKKLKNQDKNIYILSNYYSSKLICEDILNIYNINNRHSTFLYKICGDKCAADDDYINNIFTILCIKERNVNDEYIKYEYSNNYKNVLKINNNQLIYYTPENTSKIPILRPYSIDNNNYIPNKYYNFNYIPYKATDKQIEVETNNNIYNMFFSLVKYNTLADYTYDQMDEENNKLFELHINELIINFLETNINMKYSNGLTFVDLFINKYKEFNYDNDISINKYKISIIDYINNIVDSYLDDFDYIKIKMFICTVDDDSIKIELSKLFLPLYIYLFNKNKLLFDESLEFYIFSEMLNIIISIYNKYVDYECINVITPNNITNSTLNLYILSSETYKLLKHNKYDDLFSDTPCIHKKQLSDEEQEFKDDQINQINKIYVDFIESNKYKTMYEDFIRSTKIKPYVLKEIKNLSSQNLSINMNFLKTTESYKYRTKILKLLHVSYIYIQDSIESLAGFYKIVVNTLVQSSSDFTLNTLNTIKKTLVYLILLYREHNIHDIAPLEIWDLLRLNFAYDKNEFSNNINLYKEILKNETSVLNESSTLEERLDYLMNDVIMYPFLDDYETEEIGDLNSPESRKILTHSLQNKLNILLSIRMNVDKYDGDYWSCIYDFFRSSAGYQYINISDKLKDFNLINNEGKKIVSPLSKVFLATQMIYNQLIDIDLYDTNIINSIRTYYETNNYLRYDNLDNNIREGILYLEYHQVCILMKMNGIYIVDNFIISDYILIVNAIYETYEAIKQKKYAGGDFYEVASYILMNKYLNV